VSAAAPGIAPLAQAFRSPADDPVRALQRCLAAAARGREDKAILREVPSAQAEAEASRARFVAGAPLGPLDGIPIAVKDCIDVAGMPSTNGTSFLNQPRSADAPLVSRLRAAGAVIFAKTRMHELGIQPTGINPLQGTPVNPWDPKRIPGGSSSGSAVSVASGIAPVALGTDAGGSVRVPAALNGLVGLKPTFGSVPNEGVAGLTHDLDHVGPIAWTVDDAALVFEAIAAQRLERAPFAGTAALLPDLFSGAQDEVQHAVRSAAAEVFGPLDEAATPLCAWAAAVEFVIVATDSQHSCGPFLREHAAELNPDTRMILQLGAGMPLSDRRRADGVRAGMRRELDALLQKHAVLLAPATGAVAPLLHPAARRFGELDTRRLAQLAAVTFVTNLTGHPSCVVPCVRDGLPIGIQIIGPRGGEALVLAAARKVEQAFGPRRPQRWFQS
jgi:aspartyl-tRNA(Asn)/glutamyl-tRNA(Gln) amidotransferase subunit A